MKIALDQVEGKKDIKQLKERLTGIPALLFTKEDPFILYKKLEKSKASSPAKPGQKAPNDLSIEEGATPFTPGPMIGELGMLGIKTEVKDGKIHVKNAKVLVKEGEEITDKVASLLAKLGVEPMKVGLNLMLTYQDGEILEKSVLYVDEEEYINNLKTAHAEAMALAISLGMVNSDTAKPMIVKAEREAHALDEKVDLPKEEVKEEPKEEEKVEEKPTEPEPPKEEPKEEPVEEKQEETPPEPTPAEEVEEPNPVEEEVVEEPKEETPEPPKEEPTQTPEETKEAVIEPVVEQPSAPEPIPTPPGENPKIQQAAKDILHTIMGTPKSEKVLEEPQSQEKRGVDDINKFINQLKDKKSKGEI